MIVNSKLTGDRLTVVGNLRAGRNARVDGEHSFVPLRCLDLLRKSLWQLLVSTSCLLQALLPRLTRQHNFNYRPMELSPLHCSLFGAWEEQQSTAGSFSSSPRRPSLPLASMTLLGTPSQHSAPTATLPVQRSAKTSRSRISLSTSTPETSSTSISRSQAQASRPLTARLISRSCNEKARKGTKRSTDESPPSEVSPGRVQHARAEEDPDQFRFPFDAPDLY